MAQPFTIKSGDERNDVSPNAPRGYSKFNLSHRFLQTMRFGEITPSESFETLKGAKESFRLQQDTSSYSLKAPLKTDMFQKRSNFFVPLQAIIPNSWELFIAQPNNGDDVPSDVDGVVSPATLNSFFQNLADRFLMSSGDDMTFAKASTDLLKDLLIAEMFFSQGSLCKQLFIDFSHNIVFNEIITRTDGPSSSRLRSFDAFLEKCLQFFAPKDTFEGGLTGITDIYVSWYDEDNQITDNYHVVSDAALSEIPIRQLPGTGGSQQVINYRHFLDLCRQNLNFQITNIAANETYFEGGELNALGFEKLYAGFYDSENGVHVTLLPVTDDVNFDKLSSYQIICAHFFSLDHVDYIYSAELYRQMMMFYGRKILDNEEGTGFDPVYTWNGLQLRYDALSGFYIDYVLNSIVNAFDGYHSFYFDYLTALFSFRHSLRYLDYFTGGRTRPLSVGSMGDPSSNPSSISVPVVNNNVDAVDVVIAQNAARYLNFAQRVGRKISQWLDKMFPGGQPRPDFHDPQWLSSVGDALNPEQTQNTGEAQSNDANSITARFKNDSNRFMYTYEPDRPGYIISVTYYDIPRAYAYATAKENMHKDRYDRFNPFFQYNGSQAVRLQELGISGDAPFSYQGKYEEYKQNYDVCAGGFVENLPGFAFVADVQKGLPMQTNLNPTYVRSWNTELDPFYLALTGYGLAAYFHFIVKNVNLIESVRPMEYAPQLM